MSNPTAMRDRAYLMLRDAGLNVYLPGQYDGECREKYITVRNGGTVAVTKATGYILTVITGHVPMGQLTQLDDMMRQARTILAQNRDLRPRGDISPEVINNETMAYECSMEYESQCRLSF